MGGENQSESVTTEFNSVISFTEGLLRVALENLPGDIAQLTATELEKLRRPTETDVHLRVRFWKVIDEAKKAGRTSIKHSDIYNDICSSQLFSKIMETPIRLAWIVQPMRDDLDRMRNLLSLAFGKLETEFFDMPMNEKTAGHFLKAVELLMARVHGPLVHRIEAKHAHIKMTQEAPTSVKDVNSRLDELRSKLIQAPAQQRQIIPENENSTDESAIEVHATNSTS